MKIKKETWNLLLNFNHTCLMRISSETWNLLLNGYGSGRVEVWMGQMHQMDRETVMDVAWVRVK
jgi:hypothetical protein